jgi:hypothetical protein
VCNPAANIDSALIFSIVVVLVGASILTILWSVFIKVCCEMGLVTVSQDASAYDGASGMPD